MMMRRKCGWSTDLIGLGLGLAVGGMLFVLGWLGALWPVILGAGLAAVLGAGFYLYRRKHGLSKGWIAAATTLALVLGSAGWALAAYTGPNRTTTTTVWDRQKCDYHAIYSTYGCNLTLYHTTGGCDSAGSTAGYFNPTACVGWPGTCGVDFSCSISQTGSRTVGCNQGDAACTSHTVTSNLPPATVSGSTACADPGNAGWCRGGATLNLTGTDPVSGWTITAIESDLFGNLCTGSSPTLSCTWTFPEGTTSLNFWADSSHGDTSLEASASMKLDSAAPSVSIAQTSGTAGNAGWYTTPVTFTGLVSDSSPSSGIAMTQYVLDGGAPQDGGSVTVSSDGSHTVYFTAEDVAGNASAPSATDSVRIDRTPPVVSSSVTAGTAGTNGWYTTPVQLTATASDATSGLDPAGLSYTVDGGAAQSGGTATVSGDGTHTVVFSVHDIAGNLGSYTETVKIDTTPPTAGFSVPAPTGSNGWYVAPVTVTPSASDATSGVASSQVSLDGSTWSPSVTISADGVYTVYARATDNAGNASAVLTKTIGLDMTPPVESLVLPPTATGWYTTSQPAITVSATDATSGVGAVEYAADGGSWAASLPTLADGSHTVRSRVTDKAGNASTSAPATVKIDATPPQSAFTTPAEGATVVAVGTFTMSGTTTDATSGVAGAQISLDGGDRWSPLTMSGGTWSYVWDTAKFANGTYNVQVRGMDVAGNVEHTAHVTIIVANQGPGVSITKSWVIWQTAQVKITTHVLPVVGAEITISHQGGYDVWSAAYSGGDLPYTFQWGGITSKGRRAPAGFYTVRVEIWDNYGHHASDSGTLWIPLPLPAVTPTATTTFTPSPTRAPTTVPFRAEPSPTTRVMGIAVPQPTSTPTPVVPVAPLKSGVKSGAQLTLLPLDPVFFWPALALGAFLAVLGASTFSDQKHKAYRNLDSTMETVMRQNRRTGRQDEE